MKKQLTSKITLLVWVLVFAFKEVMEMKHRMNLPYSDLVNTAFRTMMFALMIACAVILITVDIASYLHHDITAKRLLGQIGIILLCLASTYVTNYFYKLGVKNFQLTSMYKYGIIFTLNSIVCFMYLFKSYFFEQALEESKVKTLN